MLVYNPELISEDELPASVLDLTGPEWKGKVGVVQAGAWGDLVGVTGDPTRDVTLLEHPVFVMKGGETVKAPE